MMPLFMFATAAKRWVEHVFFPELGRHERSTPLRAEVPVRGLPFGLRYQTPLQHLLGRRLDHGHGLPRA